MISPNDKVSHGVKASWQYALKNDGSRAIAWFSRSAASSSWFHAGAGKTLSEEGFWREYKDRMPPDRGCRARSMRALFSRREVGLATVLRSSLRDFVLDSEYVCYIAIVSLRPLMPIATRID